MATPSSALIAPRDDIGLGFDEIDLDAIANGFVGFQIAPLIESSVAFGQYRRTKQNQLLQPRNARRNPDGSYAQIGSEFEPVQFKVERNGLEMPVDEFDSAAYLGWLDSEMAAAMLTRFGVMESHEREVIEVIDGITPTAVGNGHKFDDATAPLAADFAGYKNAFRAVAGVMPNALCLDSYVVDLMLNNSSIQDKFQGADDRTARTLSLKGLAAALGLDEVIESGGMKNTKAAPAAASLATTWPQAKALLFRKSTAGTTMVSQFMRTIHWSGGGSRPGCAFEEYMHPETSSKRIRHLLDTKVEVVNATCGMVLSTILT